jgi:4-diphosphocytidyl-2-C-methyl-D-erythritol kinase
MPTAVRSHAKINLGLGIGAPRADGFHALVTVYQTLEMHDVVTVEARRAAETAIRITSNDRRVPVDGRNTAWKMVELGLRAMGVAAEVYLHIEKRLPVQGGLGAGSANAVAALVGLEAELGIRDQGLGIRKAGTREAGSDGNAGLETRVTAGQETGATILARRLEIAARVGSDVPLFLIGGTVLGVDRGQQVYPLPDLEPVWCVVATPAVGVSTPQAFRDWDALCVEEGLTPGASTDKLNELSRAYASAFAGGFPEGRPSDQGQRAGSSGVPPVGGDLAGPLESALVRTGITSWIANDFERVVFRQHPSLAEIKRILSGSGTPEAALHASLSGSGSALFGLYQTREAAEAACGRLQAAGVGGTLTRTLPRNRYWSEMLQADQAVRE